MSVTAAGVMLAGCGTTIVEVPLNAPGRPMATKDPAAVEVFVSRLPSRPYVEVALLEAQQASGYSLDALDAVMSKLRERAGQKGCDAIIVNGANDSTVGSGSTSGGTGSSVVVTLKGYRCTCIVYTGSPNSNVTAPAETTGAKGF